MKTEEIDMWLRTLKSDGLWRKDALFNIMRCMEANAPWLVGGTRLNGMAWSPENPWIDKSREARYFELLRLGCRCIREFKSQSGQDIAGIVPFGLNVYCDVFGLRVSYSNILLDWVLLEIRNVGLVSLFSPLYVGNQHTDRFNTAYSKSGLPTLEWVISQMQ